MAKPKKPTTRAALSNNEVRSLILQYFYDRNANATSARGARGAAVRISAARAELKARHGLKPSDVWSNLTYLISQGWVEEAQVEKQVRLKSGVVIPQVTAYYKVTAAGIDKIEGPGEFTMDRFKGIRIEATGQNIITVGDGNQVNARHQDAAGALVDLRQALLTSAALTENQKLDAVSDIDTMQAQLAKAEPNRSILRAAWEGVKGLATVSGLAVNVGKLAGTLGPLL